MLTSNRGFLAFIKRFRGALAIGQILRENYLYEVHGPFVAVVPAGPTRSFPRRLADPLWTSIKSLAHWNRRRRGDSDTRRLMG